jgi:hypothetical protein
MVKKLSSLVLVLSIICITANASHGASYWAKTYGMSGAADVANSIQQTSDGGYIVGWRTDFYVACHDALILKLDSSGEVTWQKTYGGDGCDETYAIQETFNGGYIAAGRTSSFGDFYSDIWVLKLDTNGDVVWQKTYGGSYQDIAYSIQQTDDDGDSVKDDGYIVAGNTSSFGAGGGDVWVLKIDNNGEVTWQKTYGGSGSDRADSIQQTTDGGYIVAGATYSFGVYGDWDIWILKLNSSGDVIWEKTYDESAGDGAYSIQQTSDGGYIVAGDTTPIPVNLQLYDVWVLKLDSSGDISWQKKYGGSDWDAAKSIQQTSDGGYIMAGWTRSFGSGNADSWILKLDTNGDISWQKTYGGNDWDVTFSIQQVLDGGYIMAGNTVSFVPGENEIWVLKLSSIGEIPDCNIMSNSNASTSDTTVTGQNTNALIQTTSAIIADTSIIPQDTSAEITTICSWIDSDNDGIPDDEDNCLNIPNTDQANNDNDSHGDACDNCPNVDNEDQTDSDEDGIGNACDICWEVPNPHQLDSNENCPESPYSSDPICGDACEIIDSDGDGIPDDEDSCPQSNLDPTVIIDGCDSGVGNLLFEDGCTMRDLIDECAIGVTKHGDFASCVSHLTNDWKKDGLISGSDKGAMQSCAGQSDIP